MNKVSNMVSTLCYAERDVLQEMLFQTSEVFDGADLSVHDVLAGKCLASTIIDTTALEQSVKFANVLKYDDSIKKYTAASPRKPNKLRDEVIVAEQIPLLRGKGKYFLLIEYSTMPVHKPNETYTFFAELLSIALHLHLVADIHIKNRVKVRGREDLIADIEHPESPLPKDKVLVLLSLLDARKLNHEKGELVVDEYLAYIKDCLWENYGSKVYKVGGTKFAITFFEPVYDVHSSVEKVMDYFLDKNLPVAGVITPIKEDVYTALYICETHAKRMQSGIVEVVRQASSKESFSEHANICRTFLAESIKPVEEAPVEDIVVEDINEYQKPADGTVEDTNAECLFNLYN